MPRTEPEESVIVTVDPADPEAAAEIQPWPSVVVGVSTISLVAKAMTVPPVMLMAPLESRAPFAPEAGP